MSKGKVIKPSSIEEFNSICQIISDPELMSMQKKNEIIKLLGTLESEKEVK